MKAHVVDLESPHCPRFLSARFVASSLGVAPASLAVMCRSDETLRACEVVLPGLTHTRWDRDLLRAWSARREKVASQSEKEDRIVARLLGRASSS